MNRITELIPMTPRLSILILLVVIGLTGCGKEYSSDKERFEKVFQMPLPQGAQGLVNEERSPLNVWRAQWIYSCFWLPPKEMENFLSKPPEGFQPWKKDFEICGYADRDFFSYGWPQTYCSRNEGTDHRFVFFVADPGRGLVHAVEQWQ